jgi:hypothetical protein
MADVTPSVIRGILIPDPRITYADAYSDTLSSLTQAGPLPGVPVAQQSNSDLVLEAVGTQSPGLELRIRTVKPGHPGTDGAAFAWRYQGDPLWRGWDPPNAISAFEFLDRSTVADAWRFPHAVALPDGKLAVVVEAAKTDVVCWVRETDGSWADFTVHAGTDAYAFGAYPTICALPSGRLICIWYSESSMDVMVQMSYSDDEGQTWTIGSRTCLPEVLDASTYVPGRLRAAYLDGQVLLLMAVVEGTENQIRQYASSDLGGSFSLICTLDGASYACPDVVATGGKLVVAYLKERTPAAGEGSTVPYTRILGSAYTLLTGATENLAVEDANPMEWGEIASGEFTSSELAIWADEDGSIWLAGVDHDAAGGAAKELFLQRSHDGGISFTGVGSGSAPGYGAMVYSSRDAATYIRDFTVATQGGRSVMLHRFAANPGNADDSLCASYLGGFTTVCRPSERTLLPNIEAVSSWELTYLPFDLPENTGSTWTSVVAGAPTVSLTGLGLRILHGGGTDTQSWYAVPVSTVDQGLNVLVDLRVTDGQAYLDVTLGVAGPVSYTVRVTASTGTLTLRDMIAGVDIGTATGVGVTAGTQVLLSIGNDGTKIGSVRAWYCSSRTGSDRAFVELGSSDLLSTGTATASRIEFGSLSGNATGDVYFRQVSYADGVYTGYRLYNGQSNPSALLGRTYMPTPVTVDEGVRIQAVSGPTVDGDTWDIDTRYQYGIELIHPEVAPSRRRAWRSEDTATDQEIAWELGTGLTGVTSLLSPYIGVYLTGINFRTASLWGLDVVTTWHKIADIDAAIGTGLRFAHANGMVTVNNTGPNSVSTYLTANILAGSSFNTGSEVRRIRTNTGGSWLAGAAGTTVLPRLLLEAPESGDATAGTAGQIWSSEVCCVVSGMVGEYKAYKLVIDSQDTADGFFTIGNVVIGPIVPFAQEYSWGRTLAWEPSYSLTEGRSGTRSVRALGPTRRVVEVGWTDGVDVSGIGGSTPIPDYVRDYVGGDIIGTPSDTAFTVAGVVEQLQGAATPCVYLPAIPVLATSDEQSITNRHLMLYGRVLTESVRLDNVLGDEWGAPGEVFRVGTLRIEEEV